MEDRENPFDDIFDVGYISNVSSQEENKEPDFPVGQVNLSNIKDFFIQTEAIQSSFVERYNSVEEMISQGETLKNEIMFSKQLAEKVILKLTGLSNPNPALIRGIMPQCCSFIVGKDITSLENNLDALADHIVHSLEIVDKKSDRNPFENIRTNSHASFAVSGVCVSINILKEVISYNIGKDVNETVQILSEAVLEMSANAANQILPKNTSEYERQYFLDTFSRKASELMCVIYNKKVKEIMSQSAINIFSEKVEKKEEKGVIEDIIKKFKEYSSFWAGLSILFSKNISEA